MVLKNVSGVYKSPESGLNNASCKESEKVI